MPRRSEARIIDPLSSSRTDPLRPRLGDVLATLAVIELVCAPRGLDEPVGEPAIHDPTAPPHVEAGGILLAVGVSPSSTAAADLVASAGKAGASAIVLKAEPESEGSDELRHAAENAGVALLALPPEMTWSQAHSLLRTAVSGPGTLEAKDLPAGDLFALANAVATMVGGPVTIEDRHSRVLAYSSQVDGIDEPRRQTILGRRVPDEWLRRLEDAGVFRRLWAGEVVRYHAGPGFADLRPRIAVAVRAGDTILGSIWVSEDEAPLGEEAEEALREASRIAALHLIRYRAGEDVERTLRGEALRSILEGRGSVEAVAYKLGVSPDSTFGVIAFDAQATDEAEGALERERTLDFVALYGEAFRQRSASVQMGRTIYVLLPGPDPERMQRLVDLASDIVGRARESLGVGLRAGVGSVVSHLRDAPRSRREADQVLRVLATDAGCGDVASYDAARGRVALLELRDFLSDRSDLRSQRLSVIVRHDAEHGTSYIETLRAFLDTFGDIPRAARLAAVHPNTFRYRLRRLVELSDLNLDDPDERLLVSLELRLDDRT